MTDIKQAATYLGLAEESLEEAELLLKAQKPRGACSRAYYAMFDAARAGLMANGRASEQAEGKTHRGLISAFGRELVKSGRVDASMGRIFNQAQETRSRADYTAAPPTLKEASIVVAEARSFVGVLRQHINEVARSSGLEIGVVEYLSRQAGHLIPPVQHVAPLDLKSEVVEDYLSRHQNVRQTKAALEIAAAHVFRDPHQVVQAVAQHRHARPQPYLPSSDEELRGRRGLFGENQARKAARAAVPAFDDAARALQVAISAALAELKMQAEQRADRDRIPIPAPSAELSEALVKRTPHEIAADPALMAEVRTIQTALYERYGRPEAAILASGNPEEAAKLLPEGMALDGLRAVLKPLRETVLAEQELAHARYQQQSLSREGPTHGPGR